MNADVVVAIIFVIVFVIGVTVGVITIVAMSAVRADRPRELREDDDDELQSRGHGVSGVPGRWDAVDDDRPSWP
jgi:hypothetical protein